MKLLVAQLDKVFTSSSSRVLFDIRSEGFAGTRRDPIFTSSGAIGYKQESELSKMFSASFFRK